MPQHLALTLVGRNGCHKLRGCRSRLRGLPSQPKDPSQDDLCKKTARHTTEEHWRDDWSCFTRSLGRTKQANVCRCAETRCRHMQARSHQRLDGQGPPEWLLWSWVFVCMLAELAPESAALKPIWKPYKLCASKALNHPKALVYIKVVKTTLINEAVPALVVARIPMSHSFAPAIWSLDRCPRQTRRTHAAAAAHHHHHHHRQQHQQHQPHHSSS